MRRDLLLSEPAGFPQQPQYPAIDTSLPVRFNLVLPITRLGVGVFSFDPLEQLLGCSIEHLLQPALTGPVYQRPSQLGPAINVYPLAIPAGEGLSMQLGQFGELGFFADRGFLRLCVPIAMVGWLQQRLGNVIVRGPERGLSSDQRAQVAYVWLQLRQGMRTGIPVPGLGEIGVEAG